MRPPDPISNDQSCCTQASQSECVAGDCYHLVDSSSFSAVRLSAILIYLVLLWSFFSRRVSRCLESSRSYVRQLIQHTLPKERIRNLTQVPVSISCCCSVSAVAAGSIEQWTVGRQGTCRRRSTCLFRQEAGRSSFLVKGRRG